MRRFSSTGMAVGAWPLPPPPAGFREETEFAVSPAGIVYVSNYFWDHDGQRMSSAPYLLKFSATGSLLGSWIFDEAEIESQGAGSRNAYSLDASSEGLVYIAARHNDDNGEIHAYDSDGHLMVRWGRQGYGPYDSPKDSAFQPESIASRSEGPIYVVDRISGYQPSLIRVFGLIRDDGWRTRYFASRDMSGWPLGADLRGAAGLAVNTNWGSEPPPSAVPSEGFTAVLDQTLTLVSGTYCFDLVAAGGARLWVRNKLLVDQWNEDKAEFHGCLWIPTGSSHMEIDYSAIGPTPSIHLSGSRVAPGWALFLPMLALP